MPTLKRLPWEAQDLFEQSVKKEFFLILLIGKIAGGQSLSSAKNFFGENYEKEISGRIDIGFAVLLRIGIGNRFGPDTLPAGHPL
jgi:hypothetical protein